MNVVYSSWSGFFSRQIKQFTLI